MHRCFASGLLTSFLLSVIAGCQPGGPQIAPPESPTIPVSHPLQGMVTDYVDYTGRMNATNAVSIQPRVTGYLVEMPFKEGAEVKKGDLLFVIDSRPYDAQLAAAKAQVALNEASLRYAAATNARFKAASKKQAGAVSERELDQYQAQEDQATSNLNLAKANLVSALLNLEWTKVTSPIDGYISRYYLTIGNLVNQDVTQLTTVVSMDPMYAYFDMDEPTFLRINRAINEGKIVPYKEPLPFVGTGAVGLLGSLNGLGPTLAASAFAAGTTGVPVLMGMQGEEGYPHEGAINFVDNQVNPATGSISVRGVFANPTPKLGRQLLVPGMFVRIHLPIGQSHPALLVIDRAVTSDQGLKYVYAIDAENKVQQRRIVTGPLQNDGLRVIEEASFKLTDKSLKSLQAANEPQALLSKLMVLKDKEFTKKQFLARLGESLTEDEKKTSLNRIIRLAIDKGLNEDDWVVVGSLQQVRPRMTIQPDYVTMPSLANPAERTAPPVGGKAKK